MMTPKSKLYPILLISLAICSPATAFQFQDCGSVNGHLDSITVSGCDVSQDFCTLKEGTDVTLTATFTSHTTSKSATAKIWGVLSGIPIPFHLPHDDACANYGVKCPLSPNEQTTLTITMPISTSYPRIKATIRLALTDEANKNIFCTQFPAQLQ